MSGWLFGFGDFQRDIRFASKLAEGVFDLLKTSGVSLLCFVDSKRPIHDYWSLAGIPHIKDLFYLKNKRKKADIFFHVLMSIMKRGKKENSYCWSNSSHSPDEKELEIWVVVFCAREA